MYIDHICVFVLRVVKLPGAVPGRRGGRLSVTRRAPRTLRTLPPAAEPTAGYTHTPYAPSTPNTRTPRACCTYLNGNRD